MPIKHTPVLLEEVIDGLKLRANANLIDGTFGSGGHAIEILKAIAPHGKLLAFDRDPQVINEANKKFKKYKNRLILINDSYSNLETYVQRYKFSHLAGVLFDLGFSSTQLADPARGFSFQISGSLDLRYNPKIGVSAAELLNTASAADLEKIFLLGDEPQASNLTKAIIKERNSRSFTTTADLLNVVKAVKGHSSRSLPPATLVWQALRLAVNNELGELKKGLAAAVKILGKGGRLAVISFHSGEDRIVKNFLQQESRDCICPPAWPVCRCYHSKSLKIITKKPILASKQEVKENSRAGSAKLRIAEKL